MIVLGNIRDTLADRLVLYRTKLNWKQHDLAAAIDRSVSCIRGYEQKKRWPSAEELEELAKALKTSVPELLTPIDQLPRLDPEEALRIITDLVMRTRSTK